MSDFSPANYRYPEMKELIGRVFTLNNFPVVNGWPKEYQRFEVTESYRIVDNQIEPMVWHLYCKPPDHTGIGVYMTEEFLLKKLGKEWELFD